MNITASSWSEQSALLWRNSYFRADAFPLLGMPINERPSASSVLAAEYEPGEALARWMQRYADFIATKRGLATALHSGHPAYGVLYAYFNERLQPALAGLLDAAAAAGKVRGDVEPEELLGAVASLCMRARDERRDQTRRMVALLVDGLRYGASASPITRIDPAS